jgi:hypothetical protein
VLAADQRRPGVPELPAQASGARLKKLAAGIAWGFGRDENDLEFYRRWKLEHGEPHPDIIARPYLSRYQETLLTIFHELDRVRFTAEGRRPLVPDDIVTWCRVHGWPRSRVEPLWWVMSRLDLEYLQLVHERDERRRKAEEFTAKTMREPL